MKKSACLILGTCLMLQAVPLNHGNDALGAATEREEVNAVPLYSLDHARELLNDEEYTAVRQQQPDKRTYARFVYQRTRELLPKAWRGQSRRIARALIEAGNRYEMDPLFLMAVARQESRFNPKAMGRHGEIGLMQIKPSTARWLLEKRDGNVPSEERLREMLKDPATNIRYGAAYLAHLRESFNRRGNLYISAYNMGAGNVRTHLKSGVQPRIYSDQVLGRYAELASAALEPQHRTTDADRSLASFIIPTFDL